MINSSPTAPVRHSVTRRRVVTTAAWAVPAVSLAAPVPAFAAASRCTPTSSFDNLAVGSKPTTITFVPSNVTASLAYQRSSSNVGWGDTGVVARTSISPAWNYLNLEMLPTRDRPLTTGGWVEITMTFSEPIVGLSFVIHDIDSTNGGYRDTVVVNTPGFVYQLGSNLQGAGTTASPFRPVNWGDTPISSGLGDVRVTWPGSVSQITIRYISGITGSSTNQHIGIGDLSYDACIVGGNVSARSRSAVPDRTPVPLQTKAGALDDHRDCVDR